MSIITVEKQPIVYDDMNDIMYKFKFTSKNYTGEKIRIQKSQLTVFKHCLDNGVNFHDGTRTIKFDNQGSYTDMTIKLPNQPDVHYKFFDSEKQAWWQYVTTNNLI